MKKDLIFAPIMLLVGIAWFVLSHIAMFIHKLADNKKVDLILEYHG